MRDARKPTTCSVGEIEACPTVVAIDLDVCEHLLAGSRLCVGDRDFPSQRGDQFGLGAQLQMQVEENDQAMQTQT